MYAELLTSFISNEVAKTPNEQKTKEAAQHHEHEGAHTKRNKLRHLKKQHVRNLPAKINYYVFNYKVTANHHLFGTAFPKPMEKLCRCRGFYLRKCALGNENDEYLNMNIAVVVMFGKDIVKVANHQTTTDNSPNRLPTN